MELIREALWWLDAAPIRYWTVAWTAFAVTCQLVWRSAHPASATGGSGRGLLFGLSIFFTLAVFRWPSWFYPHDLNPDEAQIVSSALTLKQFPLYWKHVDGTTHGPLCEYPLVFASWLGAPFSYVTARVVALLLQAGSLLATWRTLRYFAPEPIARMAVLPGLAFWSFVSWDDFLHYSSELPGLFLLAMGTWGIARAASTSTPQPGERMALFFSGLALGGVPFGKLQSAPQAAVVTLVAVCLFWRLSADAKTRWSRIAALIAGGATVGVTLAVYLWIFGLWSQFWTSYVASALAYLTTGTTSLATMMGLFFQFSATSHAFAWFMWGNLAFALLYFRQPGATNSTLRVGTCLAWLAFAVAYYCVVRSGREAAHYLHLLVQPICLLTGFTLARALSATPRVTTTDRPTGFNRRWLAVIILTLAPQLFDRLTGYHRFVGHARAHNELPVSAAARYMMPLVRPGDTLALWGWEPRLLVEVQLPHGTREPHTANQLMHWPLTDFYVKRYLFDFTRWKPTWFVDVVGPNSFVFNNRLTDTHERIPALRDIVARDYEFLADLDGKRIYRLKSAPNPP